MLTTWVISKIRKIALLLVAYPALEKNLIKSRRQIYADRQTNTQRQAQNIFDGCKKKCADNKELNWLTGIE